MLINMAKPIYLPPRRFEACCPFLGGKPQISVTINIQFLSYTILLYSILNFVVQSIIITIFYAFYVELRQYYSQLQIN